MDAYFRRASGGRQRIDAPVLLVQLIDGKVGATELDVEAHQYFAGVGIPTLKVATKIDKLPRGQRARSLKEIRQRLELPESVDLVPFSAVSGEGIQQLWSAITAFLDACREEHQGEAGTT